MSAKVSEDHEASPGVSYASVLIPRGSSGNNKENEGCQLKPAPKMEPKLQQKRKLASQPRNEKPPSKDEPKESVEEAPQKVENGTMDDGEFQTVAPKSARRKEKLKENKEHQRNGHKERHRGERRPSEPKERHKEREKKRDQEEHKDGSENECESKPVRYVEAPLPAVNPWMKSKPTVKASPQPSVAPTAPAVAPPLAPPPTQPSTSAQVVKEKEVKIEKEKRVLQPQQQQPKTGMIFCVSSVQKLGPFFK